MVFYVNLIFLLLFSQANAWKFFHLGRRTGGNLGKPEGNKSSLIHFSFVKTRWFPQILDHFNQKDETTWKQKYYVNDQFYEEGGPVFLMIGGESEASDSWMTYGAWVDYAKKFKALLFQVEHRYYGESLPTEDLSVENLVHLSSEQALADLANFIPAMNNEFNLVGKWIAFGGSYAGSLAAWLRMKYPHLVHGAMSASGPLLAEVDFFDYFRVVDESLKTHSQECVDFIKNANDQVKLHLSSSSGIQKLNKAFHLCDPLETLIGEQKHLSNFWNTLADNFARVVQYNRISSGDITIDDICNIMVDKTIGDPLERLANVNSLLLNNNFQECLNYNYDNMIEELQDISSFKSGSRQWIYQTCTEFGFYQTSTYSPHVFGDQFPVDFFIKLCQDIFGSSFDDKFLNQAIDRTNKNYGGTDIKVSNVVFVHGSIDPWHALGIIETKDQDAPAIYIPGVAHCANIFPRRVSDPPELIQARKDVQNYIEKWLGL